MLFDVTTCAVFQPGGGPREPGCAQGVCLNVLCAASSNLFSARFKFQGAAHGPSHRVAEPLAGAGDSGACIGAAFESF